ncbi:exonuclease [Nitzschia inconspicua]|uniref:Exonuclease n=1 Tax=Nitzschia inconspicua TaxID=303405 RepID=A0A9K3KHU7_9STRA|nr:exonuclease [Nitzschia inconspicua]
MDYRGDPYGSMNQAASVYGYASSSYENEQYPEQQQQQQQQQQQLYDNHGQQEYYEGDLSQQLSGQFYNNNHNNYNDDDDGYPMMDTLQQPQQQPSYYHYHEDPNNLQQQQLQSLFYGDPPSHQQQAYYTGMEGVKIAGGTSSDWNTMMMMQYPQDAIQPWQQGSMGTQQQQQQQPTVEKGTYYQESEFSVELLYGHAVNALAYDPMYECLYVAGTTQNVSTTRFNAHRASLLCTYTTSNPSPQLVQHGQTSILYSSVAGHPEASSSTLQAVYQTMYGISKVQGTPHTTIGGPRGRNHPPSHAYLAPYGGGELAESVNAPHNNNNNSILYSGGVQQQLQQQLQSQQLGHMGITDLLPLGNGCTASVSPSAVRIHSCGGLQLTDHVIDGMLCGTIHPYSGPGGATHISVGGLSMAAIAACMSTESTTGPSSTTTQISKQQYQKDNCNIHCLDLYQGLRPVYSRAFKDQSATGGEAIAVTVMATSHERSSVVAGCSDGNIRILDGSLRELATVKSHVGGVSSISISPDGLLIATTGFSSKAKPTDGAGNASTTSSSALYAFPDPKAYIYDIRYLGRGGISHPFAGVKGAPRFARFIPDIDGCASNRLLLASGKPGGGMQIVTPFEPQDGKTTSFLIPQLQQGESLTAFSTPVIDQDELAVGTSFGRVFTYRLEGFGNYGNKTKTREISATSTWSKKTKLSSTTHSFGDIIDTKSKPTKQTLDIPPFGPPLPDLSLEPMLLQGDPNLRNGTSEEMRSIFGMYTLVVDPTVTCIGNTPDDAFVTFGAIGSTPIVADKRRTVAKSLLKETTVGEREFMLTVPTSKLGVDLLSNHAVVSKRYKGKKVKESLANPNKTLYNTKISSLCYEAGCNGSKAQSSRGQRTNSGGSTEEIMVEIPSRYQLQTRPAFSASGAFDPSDYNDTGLLPGWDYEPSMPNSWVSPVLLLFYFIPEIRAAALASQVNDKSIGTKSYEKALVPELGFVFDQMENLSRNGLLYPSNRSPYRPKIGAWVPSNFLTFVSTMAEAEQLQVLDGSPAAVDRPRRPESFYRFLAYHLDKELSSSDFVKSRSLTNLMDSINGIDFFSSNEFIESKSSPATHSVTRALTLELSYDMLPPGADKPPVRFGELLQHSLCRGTRLRAWNSKSRSYETIVQRKIVTSLPKVLTLACACAGRKEEDGLWAWRTDHGNEPWLPEFVEIELLADGNVEVVEFHQDANGQEKTQTKFGGKKLLPAEVSALISESSVRQKRRYRLDAVMSYVVDSRDDGMEDEELMGHHVLHARVPKSYKRGLLESQAEAARRVASQRSKTSGDGLEARGGSDAQQFVLSAAVTVEDFLQRAANIDSTLEEFDKSCSDGQDLASSDWVLYNGFKVSKAFAEDARAFHVPFKEPVLVVFRAVDESGEPVRSDGADVGFNVGDPVRVPPAALKPPSLSKVNNVNDDVVASVHEGRPLAFDAEFVAVQEEDSTLSETGQKLVSRETRHALGRKSVFDCMTKKVLLDDHVLPREPVVDFLTRFSGIVADDLDPSRAKHRIISTRNAYLQMRFLMEQGCIFVGHGLKQDFATVNLIVPPHQILDTVEIFHQPGMRYVSLRFLANYFLGRDMQQDIHDSVEDAQAAFELYEKALEWKKEGMLHQRLQEMYSYGDKTSWKIGVSETTK